MIHHKYLMLALLIAAVMSIAVAQDKPPVSSSTPAKAPIVQSPTQPTVVPVSPMFSLQLMLMDKEREILDLRAGRLREDQSKLKVQICADAKVPSDECEILQPAEKQFVVRRVSRVSSPTATVKETK